MPRSLTRYIFFVILGFIILVAAFLYFYLFGFHLKTSEGSHIGVVTRTEILGVLPPFKPRQAYFKTDEESSDPKKYCVEGRDTYEDLEEASETGARVRIEYVSYLWPGVAYCYEDRELITNVDNI
jgi:hypothetical protein